MTVWSVVLLQYSGSQRFGKVEPPRTDVKCPYGHVFLCSAVVQRGLNHPELTYNDLMVSVLFVVQWFEDVH